MRSTTRDPGMAPRKVVTGMSTAVVGALVLGAAVGVVLSTAGGGDASAPVSESDVVMVHASDRLPSRTAADWVTHADYVVAATAISETNGKPIVDEYAPGEGIISRKVQFKVDEILWAAGDPAVAAPKTVQLTAFGAVFKNGDRAAAKRLAAPDSPRFEPGHRYVMALAWEEARCNPGDPKVPARWSGLGSYSTIPFDGGIAGEGEVAGRRQSASVARQAVELKPKEQRTFEDEMVGLQSRDIKAALQAAEPRNNGSRYELPPAPCK